MKVKEYAGFSAKPLRARVNTENFRANYDETFAHGELTNAQVFELARGDETMGEARERLVRERLPVAREVPAGTKFVRVDLPPDHPAVTVPAQMKYGNVPAQSAFDMETRPLICADDPRFPSAFPLGKCVCWDTGCYSCRCKDAGRARSSSEV